MATTESPLIAFVGFRRHRLGVFGTVRVLVARDGRVRILGRKGRVALDVAATALTARLTTSKMVELRTDADVMRVWGIAELTTIKRELKEIAAAEYERCTADGTRDVTVIGPLPSRVAPMVPAAELVGVLKLGRALTDALHERGVGQG